MQIPFIAQPEGSHECGVACVAMILHSRGIRTPYAELATELEPGTGYNYLPQLGTALNRRGIQSTIVTAHPGLIQSYQLGEPSVQFKARTHLRYQTETDKQKHLELSHFETYRKHGGKFISEIPSGKHLRDAFATGKQVLALTSTQFHEQGNYGINPHFVVVTNATEQSVTFLNPGRPNNPEYTTSLDAFLYATYVSTALGLDNGSFLIIEP